MVSSAISTFCTCWVSSFPDCDTTFDFQVHFKSHNVRPLSRNDVSHAFHSVADEVCTDNRFMQIMHLLNSVCDFL